MNIDEFIKQVTEMFPLHWESDFRKELNGSFESYIKIVKELDDKDFSGLIKETLVSEISKLCGSLNEIIECYYDGRHLKAMESFRSLMIGDRGLFKMIGLDEIKLSSDGVPTIYYRARPKGEKYSFSLEEMFHIPLDKRGIIQTRRYSSPGYPCLYLGNTIYSCWEELRRPHIDDLMISGFKVAVPFNVFDMRIPSAIDYESEKLEKTLLKLPLVLSCSFVVRNDGDVFKPEYILPQMLVETIIDTNRHKMEKQSGPYDLTWGVEYTSTHIDKSFPYPVSYLENLALPVVKSNSGQNYCEFLASLFEISMPMCHEYEPLRANDNVFDCNTLEGSGPAKTKEYYNNTSMGYMESRIMECGVFAKLPHLVLNAPDAGITVPADGSPVPIDLKASGEWRID